MTNGNSMAFFDLNFQHPPIKPAASTPRLVVAKLVPQVNMCVGNVRRSSNKWIYTPSSQQTRATLVQQSARALVLGTFQKAIAYASDGGIQFAWPMTWNNHVPFATYKANRAFRGAIVATVDHITQSSACYCQPRTGPTGTRFIALGTYVIRSIQLRSVPQTASIWKPWASLMCI